MKTTFAILLAFAWLAIKPVLAADFATPLPIEVNTVRQAPPGCLPDVMIHIGIETNKFLLRLPDGYRMATDYAQHRIVMSRVDGVCTLAFRIVATPLNNSSYDPTTYRHWLFSAHPEAKILNEFSATASNMAGPGFALQWRRADGLLESERIAYIPCYAGILEFSVTSIAARADEAAAEFQMFLLAFRAPVNGKLEAPVRFNQS